jgi:hypothetical protein
VLTALLTAVLTGRRPSPTPTPTPTLDPSPAVNPSPVSDPSPSTITQVVDGAHTAGAFLVAHPGLVALVAIVVLLVWRSEDVRKKHEAATGEYTPKAHQKWTRLWRYTMVEGTRPMSGKPGYEWLTPRATAIAWISVGVGLLALGPVLHAPGDDIAGAVLLLACWAFFHRRFAPVRDARRDVIDTIFQKTKTILKTTRGAELNKEGWVRVGSWRDGHVPEVVAIGLAKEVVHTPKMRQELESIMNSDQVLKGIAWTYAWDAHEVVCTAQPPLPANAPYPFPTITQFAWNEFPLGVAAGGVPVVWDPTKVPHALIAGTSGSGKSVTQRNILVHALQSDQWLLFLIDPKRVELSMYKDGKNVVVYAVDDEQMLDALEQAAAQMAARYQMMEAAGANHYRTLPDPPAGLLIVVDEATSLLKETGDREVDAGKKRCKALVGKIAREGRAAGVHLILATQRPDADVLGGDTRSTIEGRIAMGRMGSTASLMVLGNDLATLTPGQPRGRGVFNDGTDVFAEFQSYFLDGGPDNANIAAAVQLSNMMLDGSLTAEAVKEAMEAQFVPSTAPVLTGPAKWLVALRTKWAALAERIPDHDDDGDGDGDGDAPARPRRRRTAPAQTTDPGLPPHTEDPAQERIDPVVLPILRAATPPTPPTPPVHLTENLGEFALDDAELARMLGEDLDDGAPDTVPDWL